MPTISRSYAAQIATVLAALLVACGAPIVSLPGGAPPPTAQPDAVRAPRLHPATLLRGATLWTATGEVLDATDLLLRDNRIAAIGKDLAAPSGALILDVRGKIVTPGLVDMHSHLGVYPMPPGKAHADGNEMTQPTTPMVRAIDAFDPEDPAIARAVAGGVTTALILPGSGNVMGGQALYVKLHGRTVGEMQLPGAPRAMKWAMGENPKRVYGGRGTMPMSRMGHGWVMRKALFEARELLAQQRAWDDGSARPGPRPQKPELEPLVALLSGQVSLQVHCYEVHDIETLVRVAREFGFQVAAIHHALEAWKVPELLKDNGIAVATFADLWGFKLEAWDASVHAPRILHEAGVVLALKTDHPVIDAHEFIFEAAKAHHHGLPEQAALQAVTRNPARAIGLGDRLGTLEVGKAADVAVWPGSPLRVGAVPERVFVDGVQVVGDGRNLQAQWSAGPGTDARGVCCD
ncbi:MAG: amidohydrolase [Myxococcales bacterium]|nr:amidohydrolase [Myxococcales bacterium]